MCRFTPRPQKIKLLLLSCRGEAVDRVSARLSDYTEHIMRLRKLAAAASTAQLTLRVLIDFHRRAGRRHDAQEKLDDFSVIKASRQL